MTDFIECTHFEGIRFPRNKHYPDGEQLQSFVACVCGRMWNAHRFRDGACPQPHKAEMITTPEGLL